MNVGDSMESNLKDIIQSINDNISKLDSKRESALKVSRDIVRRSCALIMACHRNASRETLLADWNELHNDVMKTRDSLSDPDAGQLLYSGFFLDAQTEAAEAGILVHLKLNEGSDEMEKNELFPGPGELGVGETAYLHGLGDVIGELRRFTLEQLRIGDMELATWYYDHMEEIYSLLKGLAYSHVSSKLRNKMDTGRVLLERTLGELVNIKHMKSLELELASGNR